MKLTTLVRATLLAFALVSSLGTAQAGLTVDPGYNATSVYTDTDSNSIVSFDWDASNNLYFQTAVTSDFSGHLGGFYQVTAGTTYQLTPGSTGNFAGASVVSIGSHVYFNDGFSNIYSYTPGSPLGASPAIISSTPNYALFSHAGELYLTGSGPSTNNQISHSALSLSGTLVNDPSIGFEHDNAYSGPLDFDAAGNLYYAPGFDLSGADNSIYKWTAAQVAAALLNPSTSPLVIGDSLASGNALQWVDYAGIYSSYAGGTSLLIDGNQLYLTLTNFGGPSALATFGIDVTGTFSGVTSTLLTEDASSNASLGQLRLNNGDLFISDGTRIYEISAVPEPSTFFLLALGLLGLGYFQRHRARKLAAMAVVVSSGFFFR